MRFSTTLDRIRESRREEEIDYAEMTLEELEVANRELRAQRQEIKQEQRELVKHLDYKYAEREALRKLETMSDAEKQAMAQAVKAQGIATDEEFGSLTT